MRPLIKINFLLFLCFAEAVVDVVNKTADLAYRITDDLRALICNIDIVVQILKCAQCCLKYLNKLSDARCIHIIRALAEQNDLSKQIIYDTCSVAGLGCGFTDSIHVCYDVLEVVSELVRN